MYTTTEVKMISLPNETPVYLVKITADTAADIPQPRNCWAAGSELEVLENGGSKYKLTNSREWVKVNFKTGAGGGDNSEFTPRFIGTYSVPWLIEGMGSLSARLVQLQKNIFSLDVNGGGAAFTVEAGNAYILHVDIPVKRYNPSNMTPYSALARFYTSDSDVVIGMVGFYEEGLQIVAPANTYTSISMANIIIYGELIEDETT